MGHQQALRDRTTELAAAFLDAALRHAKRDACSVLWTAALAETDRRLEAAAAASSEGRGRCSRMRAGLICSRIHTITCTYQISQQHFWFVSTATEAVHPGAVHKPCIAPSAGAFLAAFELAMQQIRESCSKLDLYDSPDPGACMASAARAVSLVAQMAGFHHGSRVGDWSPLTTLISRLLQPGSPFAKALAADTSGPLAHAAEAGSGDARSAVSAAAEARDMQRQILRLLQAVFLGHLQACTRLIQRPGSLTCNHGAEVSAVPPVDVISSRLLKTCALSHRLPALHKRSNMAHSDSHCAVNGAT